MLKSGMKRKTTVERHSNTSLDQEHVGDYLLVKSQGKRRCVRFAKTNNAMATEEGGYYLVTSWTIILLCVCNQSNI